MFSLEFIGTFFTIFIVALANSGGLASGGVVIPISLAFFKFDTREAIAISNMSIFVATLIRLLISLRQVKKQETVPIEYGIAAIAVPLCVTGAVLGVMLSITIPEIVIASGFTIILLILFVFTFRKALDKYK